MITKKIAMMLTLAAAVAALIFVTGCGKKEAAVQRTSINIKGSDTMVNLMSNLAEEYMKEHPNVNIAVTGGGSGTGIAALLNGTTEICAASRAMQQKEIDLAKSKGITPVEKIIGLDGLAVMVNPKNPIGELTIEQLRKIYTGEYTNWKDVGGQNQEIVLLSRESNSGTYVYFQEHVLNKADYSPKARLMPSTAAIVQSAGSDAGAIGYGGVAYAENPSVKIVSVKDAPDSVAVQPTEANVVSGSYPISRPLFLYTNGQPSGPLKEFFDFCNGPRGQAIVKDTGYVPLKK